MAQNTEKDNQKIRKEEPDYDRNLFETRLKFQTELNAVKANKAKGSESTKNSGGSATGLAAKLPTLVITKFNGMYQDWPRFQGQFSEAIDKSSIASITKFSYLKPVEVRVKQVDRLIGSSLARLKQNKQKCTIDMG